MPVQNEGGTSEDGTKHHEGNMKIGGRLLGNASLVGRRMDGWMDVKGGRGGHEANHAVMTSR